MAEVLTNRLDVVAGALTAQLRLWGARSAHYRPRRLEIPRPYDRAEVEAARPHRPRRMSSAAEVARFTRAHGALPRRRK